MNKKYQITVFAIILLLFFYILIKNNESEYIEITEIEEKNESKTNFTDSTSKKISLESQSNMKVSKVKESNIDKNKTISNFKNQIKIDKKTKNTKVNSSQRNKTLEEIKKDFQLASKKINFDNTNINFLPDPKTDPYLKPLMPFEIEKIKKKAFEYEPKPVSAEDTVIIRTNQGNMKLILYPEIAPKHCYNFKKLANSGFYDGTTFHRIIPSFMIQGGDILSRDSKDSNDGQGGPGWTVDAEFSKKKHEKGVLSMARSSDPNSAGSQFFICHSSSPHLDGKYTVFGKVVQNINLIDKIANIPTIYSETRKMCYNRIPEGSNEESWVELIDPKTRKKIYSKVPEEISKDSFRFEINSKLRNNQPAFAIRILSIRVN